MAITKETFGKELESGIKEVFGKEYNLANDALKYKIKERYNTGWTDPKSVFNAITPRSVGFSMEMTEEDLNHEAYNTPIATLQNLWLARFGAGWIDTDKLREELFFVIAVQRLLSAGRMDRADMVGGRGAVRLIPE
jgi:hypothetical protein